MTGSCGLNSRNQGGHSLVLPALSDRQRLLTERCYYIEHRVETDRATLDVLGADQTVQAIVPLFSANAVHAVAKLSKKPRLLNSQF
jgi:hypothetical protein